MPSELYLKIWKAVRERRQVLFTYKHLPRTVCPVILGYGEDGQERAFAFQIGGRTSGKGKLPQWRCFHLEKVRDAEIRDGDWLEGSSHEQAQSCISFVDVDANIPETLTRKAPLPSGSPKLKPPRNEKRRPSFHRKKSKPPEGDLH
jgi:hypothetical protein